MGSVPKHLLQMLMIFLVGIAFWWGLLELVVWIINLFN